MILDSRLNLQVEASLEEAHLVFNLVEPSYGEYLYISDLDRIAISILGLRELESSLPLTLEASAAPSGVWSTAATFTLSITDLEASRITDYSVVAQAPRRVRFLPCIQLFRNSMIPFRKLASKALLKLAPPEIGYF